VTLANSERAELFRAHRGRHREVTMKYKVGIDDETVELEVKHSGDLTQVVVGDRVITADVVRIGGSPVYSLVLDGKSYEVSAHRRDGKFELVLAGENYHADVMDERAMRIAEATADVATQSGETINAPMPGVVVGIAVAAGDTVEAGQGVLTLEAMKMENELKSTVEGVIKEIKVEVGQGVAQGEPLVVIV
jgi:biotin carboxyl carrier protein